MSVYVAACRLFFSECVLHASALVSARDGVCSGQTLCGHRECEKLGVFTALEQF